MKNRKRFFYFLSVLTLALVWEITARLVNQVLVLPPLSQVLVKVFEYLTEKKFRVYAAFTFGRVLVSFSVTFVLGLILGTFSGLSENFRSFIKFPLALIRSTPVVAFIMILLFWFPSSLIPSVSAILMTLPVLTDGVSDAVRNTDKRLLEMAQVFHLPFRTKLSGIYLPCVRPYAGGSLHTVYSLTWKVVAAGELLSLPRNALGTMIQDNRIIMNSQSVYALILLLTGLGLISEFVLFKGFGYLGVSLARLRQARAVPFAVPAHAFKPSVAASRPAQATDAINVKNLSFSYGEKEIFSDLTLKIDGGKITALTAPTGTGKTTLLKILSGIIPSSDYTGEICCPETSFIFQDERLVPELSVLKNIALPLYAAYPKKEALSRAYSFLQKVGLEEKAFCKAGTLSGGEKQKVQAARAFAYDAPVILMDEGTSSLDSESKAELWNTIKSLLSENPRTLLFVTHSKEEAETYAESIIRLP